MSFDTAVRDPSIVSGHSEEAPSVSISGYLYKKTRDGRWQRRWFETNGYYLTYYKSKKMEKLLAALSLPQVGEITLVSEPSLLTSSSTSSSSSSPSSSSSFSPNEPNDGLFSIELNSRIYTLRGKDKEEAMKWVEILVKLRDQGSLLSSRISTSNQDISRMQSFHIEQNTGGKSKLVSNENSGTANWVKSSKLNCAWCC